MEQRSRVVYIRPCRQSFFENAQTHAINIYSGTWNGQFIRVILVAAVKVNKSTQVYK